MASKQAARRLEQLQAQISVAATITKTPSGSSEVVDLLSAGRIEEASQKALNAFLQPPRYKANARQFAVLQGAEKSIVEVNGDRIQRYVWRSEATSSIIVSHGFGTSAAFVTPIVAHLLSKTNCRIVAVDQAAHGVSSGTKVGMDKFVSVLRAVVDVEMRLGKTIKSMIGHSLGGTAIVMLFDHEPTLFMQQIGRPSIVAINPPLQSATLMQGFCAQHGLPLSLVDGMLAQPFSAPEPVLSMGMAKNAWADGLRVLIVQDAGDAVSNPRDTEQLKQDFQTGGARLSFEITQGLGHFRAIGTEKVLNSIGRFIDEVDSLVNNSCEALPSTYTS